MEREKIADFINSIFVPFSVELYKASKVDDPETEDKNIYYPDCCKLASNILSTFLNKVTDGDFICCLSKARFIHSWCCSYKMDIVIDVTGFQFDNDLYDNRQKIDSFHQTELSLQELEHELSNRSFFFSIKEYMELRKEYFIVDIHSIPDTKVDKKEYSLTEDSFLGFLNDNFKAFTENKLIMNY